MPNEPYQMVDLQGLHARMAPELARAMAEVVNASAFIKGTHVATFESRLARALEGGKGTPSCHVATCGNGTDALALALRALGVGPGDEVIVPDFTFIATAEVVALAGATPVFADVDPATFQLDPTSAERARSSRTKAVVPVHLFGQCADMDALVPWAASHGIAVLEDNAQSLGATWCGDAVSGTAGLLGQLGTTSFFPSKNLGALGDGGAVLGTDEALVGRVRRLANHGADRKYHHLEVGVNSRLDGLQAAFLNVKLSHFDAMVARRREAAAMYDRALAAANARWAADRERAPETAQALAHGGTREPVQGPVRDPRSTHMFHQYCVLLPSGTDRDAVQDRLVKHGIPTAVYYPTPLSSQPAFSGLGRLVDGGTPVAHEVAGRILALPMHTELTADMVGRIIDELFRTLKDPKARP